MRAITGQIRLHRAEKPITLNGIRFGYGVPEGPAIPKDPLQRKPAEKRQYVAGFSTQWRIPQASSGSGPYRRALDDFRSDPRVSSAPGNARNEGLDAADQHF